MGRTVKDSHRGMNMEIHAAKLKYQTPGTLIMADDGTFYVIGSTIRAIVNAAAMHGALINGFCNDCGHICSNAKRTCGECYTHHKGD